MLRVIRLHVTAPCKFGNKKNSGGLRTTYNYKRWPEQWKVWLSEGIRAILGKTVSTGPPRRTVASHQSFSNLRRKQDEKQLNLFHKKGRFQLLKVMVNR